MKIKTLNEVDDEIWSSDSKMADKIKNFYGKRRNEVKTDRDVFVSSSSLSSSSSPSSHFSTSSKLSSILHRAELKAAEYKRKRLVVDFPSSISHFRFWRVFAWQENAFDAVRESRRRDLHVFSFETAFGESNAKGQPRRKFLGQAPTCL